MTKIKNFRIILRPRDIARWLKRERGIETTPDVELSIENLIKEGKGWVTPSAVYTTLTRQIAEKTTALVFPNKAIAVSVIAVSIGTSLEDKRLASEAEDPSKESFLAALLQEALSQSLQFAIRLLQEQAKEEDCEMSTPVSALDLPTEQLSLPVDGHGQTLASSLATLVGVQRIGIALDASTHEFPPYARVAWLFWTPVGKRTAKRAEKVAA